MGFDEKYEAAIETADEVAGKMADAFVREVFQRLGYGEPDGMVMHRVAESMLDAISPEIETRIEDE